MPKNVIVRKQKARIEKDLKKNPRDPRYSFFTPRKSKSAVWKNFHVLRFNESVEPYARCRECLEILAYSSRSGTGSLLRHKCRNKFRYKHISGDEDQETAADDDNKHNFHVNGDDPPMDAPTDDDLKESPDHMPNPLNEESFDANSSQLPASKQNKDQFDAFGENVAHEMRLLNGFPDVQFQLKTAILRSILQANTDAYELKKLNRN